MVKRCCDMGDSGNVAVEVQLQPVFSGKDENANKSWSKWTPSGQVQMQITNPEASGQFEVGKPYFVDFTPAGEAE
jgi:hypothetical protein